MPQDTGNVLPVLIDRVAEAIAAVIAAPGAGKRIIVDKIVLTTAGTNTVTLTGSIAVPFQLIAGTPLEISNDTQNHFGIFPCDDNQALSLTQSAPNRVTGYVLYRIFNN